MPSTSTTAGRTDTFAMVLVHQMMRREFAAAPGLVRNSGGHRQRAAVVADHLAFLLKTLHTHHVGEDELLWPKLLERTTVNGDLIARMETQHEQVADLINEIEVRLAEWRDEPDPTAGQTLADLFEQLADQLEVHLEEEEDKILPIAAEHLTQQEWDELGEHGFGETPKNRRLVVLGSILDGASDEESAKFLTMLPVPARVAWRLVGRRQYRRDKQRIHGTS